MESRSGRLDTQYAGSQRTVQRGPVLLQSALRRVDAIEQDGDIGAHDAALRFRKAGRRLAVATIFCGRECLAAELAIEQGQSP